MKEYYEKLLKLREEYEDAELARQQTEIMASSYEAGYLQALGEVLDIIETSGTYAPEHMISMISASTYRMELVKKGKIDKVPETL